MKLTHLGVSHFRSIGETPVIIDLEKKITILVGQNDCGKSNVLRGLERMCMLWPVNKWDQFTPIDFHQRDRKKQPCIYLRGVEDDENANQSSFPPVTFHGPDNVRCAKMLDQGIKE